jgi:hypothetical protein
VTRKIAPISMEGSILCSTTNVLSSCMIVSGGGLHEALPLRISCDTVIGWCYVRVTKGTIERLEWFHSLSLG